VKIKLLLTIIAGCLALPGIVCLTVGFVWYQNTRSFVQTAEHAEGTVTELVERLGNEDDTTYSPVVEFTDCFGQQREYRSSISSSPPDFSVGDKVPILYDKNNPDSVKINHWLYLYWVPLLCLFLACDSFVMAIILFVVTRFMG